MATGECAGEVGRFTVGTTLTGSKSGTGATAGGLLTTWELGDDGGGVVSGGGFPVPSIKMHVSLCQHLKPQRSTY